MGFHERGHLKEFSIEIYEWSGKSWESYVANNVQIQLYMMSPYVLKTLYNYQKPDLVGSVSHHSRSLMSMGFSSLWLSIMGLVLSFQTDSSTSLQTQ